MAHWSDSLERVLHPDGRVLIGASFRGVPFFVESSDRSGGRRIVTHEFAQSDLPAHDDLGRKARVFRVMAYVLGVKYLVQRDALLAALEDENGVGELIHPYYGPKRVRSGIINVRESVREGGMATFQIEFLDAPLTVAPSITQDLAQQVTIISLEAFAANQAAFEAAYDVVGQPPFATESLQSQLTSLTDSVDEGLSPLTETTQELAMLSVSVEIITNQAASLVSTPADVINALLGAVTQLEESIENSPKEILKALLDSYDVEPIADVLGDTATRVQERANQLALSDGLRRALVIQAASMMPAATFDTTEDATELRNRAVTALDELASTATDAAYPSIVALRSAVTRAVPGDAVLASVQTIHRNVDLPSLVLSYQLYGHVDSADDIAARNGIQNPAFISGDIEVLSFG